MDSATPPPIPEVPFPSPNKKSFPLLAILSILIIISLAITGIILVNPFTVKQQSATTPYQNPFVLLEAKAESEPTRAKTTVTNPFEALR